MGYPTIKRMVRDLNIDEATAATVRGLMVGDVDPTGDEFPRTQAWTRQCYNRPDRDTLAVCAIDEALGACGVESAKVDRGYTSRCYVDYCNTGDVYALTVCLGRDNWGNAVWSIASVEILANRAERNGVE